jgi:hypothetical protein
VQFLLPSPSNCSLTNVQGDTFLALQYGHISSWRSLAHVWTHAMYEKLDVIRNNLSPVYNIAGLHIDEDP